MEVKITKKDLSVLLGKVVNILNPKPTIPVLSHILMETGKNRITVTGTDLEISIKLNKEIETIKEGRVLIPGRKLLEVIREFPEVEINLKSEKESQLNLSSGRINLTLVGLRVDDFPLIPKPKTPTQFKINTSTLKKCINCTKTTVVIDENKPNLSGIFFTTEDGWLTTVSTDTRRLARYRSKTNLTTNVKFILPLKTTDEIKNLWEEEKEIEVSLGSNQVIFSGEGITLTSQIIEGIFPDYTTIIPKESELLPVIVPLTGFISALRRMKQIVSAGKNMVKMEMGKNLLKISGETAGIGEGCEEVEVVYQGTPKTFYFNPDYLIEGVKNIEDEEEFFFGLNPNTEKPSLIKSTKQADYIYLAMPMWP